MDSTTVSATATRLICRQVPDWPRLAWVAMVRRHLETVWVLHGRCVETTPTSCVEAVWPGKFHEADFDLSDIVIGTGIRVRQDSIRFVSSSDTLNRLYYFVDEERTLFVANSLPALLAVANLDLVSNFDYGRAMLSIRNGLVTHAREIRSSRGNIRLLYLHNLIVTKGRATIIAKRVAAPEMLPWTLGSDYDRPVPRRFAEEAGLRRGSIATRKMASSFNRKYGRPLSVSLRKDFADFMRRHDGRTATGLVEGTALTLRALDALVLRRLRPRLRVECKSWIKLPAPSMFFIWANERRRAHYLAGLRRPTCCTKPALRAQSAVSRFSTATRRQREVHEFEA